MKTWGIIATILLLAAIGGGGWLYMQNKDLKSQNSKLEADLTSANSANAALDKKITNANIKLDVLTAFFSSSMNKTESDKIGAMIKAMNNSTLSADWTAMQNTPPGDPSGNKMMLDITTAAKNDLK